jgi:predicted kinase
MPGWIDPGQARESLLAAGTVHVVGAPGSGKTTTAARLADALGVRPVHLDEVLRLGRPADRRDLGRAGPRRPGEQSTHAAHAARAA